MSRIESRDKLFLALVLIFFAAWTYLLPPIWNHGEAREGLVVRSIVEEHQWILPYRNGEVPSKPPLFHWIAAALGHLFGLSDFTLRLASVIGAEVMAVATFILGMAIGGRQTAWLAVGALLGMYQFWGSATEARVDMVFAACVTVSIAGFFFWQRDGRSAARVVSYLAAASAVLAKGPVGAALPGIVILGFLAAERRIHLLWKFISWPLIALALLIDLGWYALAYRIGGSEFVEWQIMHENIDHLLGTRGFESNKTTFSMLVWIPTRTFPWNLALVWVLVRRLRGARPDSTERFLVVWWAAITFIFFLVTIKRSIYLLPTYPAVALLAARAITAALANANASRAESRGRIHRLLHSALRTPRRAVMTM
ncbi:MAG: ArnT family glycosyltransferase, partial [Candidatus Binatia bacterium]